MQPIVTSFEASLEDDDGSQVFSLVHKRTDDNTPDQILMESAKSELNAKLTEQIKPNKRPASDE